jgi:TolB-like protein/class 3 adenylate cyclase
MNTTRRLAAILAADVVGYSRLIGADEKGTLDRLRSIRADVIDPMVDQHHGRIVKTTGDGLLVEFGSVVDALRCATEWQASMGERNGPMPADTRTEFRIGINVGDVVVEGDDIFGDGVNVAARLEALAEPGGICVSARVQEDAAGRLDLTFEDLGEQSLKNIARPIRVYRVRLAATESTSIAATAVSAPVLALPDKPSIAVLPFQNMSGDPEQEYFADGMVEEIITALSRIRWLFVVARNSTFTYKGQAVDVKQVGRELGVRYVLEGSVRKAGTRVRITAQLIDALTSTHLWADHFDGSLEDVFALQDKVANSVAGVIEPALQAAETAGAVNQPTTDLTSYDAYLRAFAMLFASAQQIPQALTLLKEAVKRDPNYGPALAMAGICCQRLCIDGSSQDPEADRRDGIDYARRALRVAPDDPITLVNAAMPLAFFGEDIDMTSGLVDHALALNPSFARGWYISGILRMWAGDPEAALARAETALRLSPRGGIGTVYSLIGHALFLSRRFDEAVPKLLFGVEHEQHPASFRFLAACYAHLGRLDEARATIGRLRAISPLVIPNLDQFRRPEHRELLLSGLRLAVENITEA